MYRSMSFLILTTIAPSVISLDCNLRSYGTGKSVCVCNSTYCDQIPTVTRVTADKFLLYTSSKSGFRLKKSVGTKSKTNSSAYIFIDHSVKYQSINGFGGAFTDAAGINIMALSKEAQNLLMRSYFSEDGLEYNLCRVPIGGTDFSTRGYSYDDGQEDPKLTYFKLAPEDIKYKIPLIKQALNLTKNNLRFFASAWTAPKWMKTNGEYSGIGFLKSEMYQPWADYFIKFLDEYGKENITFWAITTGNEPSLALIPFGRINSVAWTYGEMRRWISKNLGPTLKNSTHSKVKIMALDDQRLFLPWFIELVFQNKEAEQYVDGIAVHWYYDTLIPAKVLTDIQTKYPNKFLLASEACEGSQIFAKHVDLGSWERGERYAFDIIEDLNHWVTGWIDWNMALDLTGGPTYIGNNVDSPILVDAKAGEFYKQPMFYALGHFSKFLGRGSVRIQSTGTNMKNLRYTAFQRSDNGTVVIILNQSDNAVTVGILDESQQELQFVAIGKSISTIVYWL